MIPFFGLYALGALPSAPALARRQSTLALDVPTLFNVVIEPNTN